MVTGFNNTFVKTFIFIHNNFMDFYYSSLIELFMLLGTHLFSRHTNKVESIVCDRNFYYHSFVIYIIEGYKMFGLVTHIPSSPIEYVFYNIITGSTLSFLFCGTKL